VNAIKRVAHIPFLKEQVVVAHADAARLPLAAVLFLDADAQLDRVGHDQLAARAREWQYRLAGIVALLQHRHRPALQCQPGLIAQSQAGDWVLGQLLAVVQQLLAPI
jgi:hypothetical protein